MEEAISNRACELSDFIDVALSRPKSIKPMTSNNEELPKEPSDLAILSMWGSY